MQRDVCCRRLGVGRIGPGNADLDEKLSIGSVQLLHYGKEKIVYSLTRHGSSQVNSGGQRSSTRTVKPGRHLVDKQRWGKKDAN